MIQVLHGLQYIHKELKVIHGAVNCDNILLSAEGDIKLGLLIAYFLNLADFASEYWR